MYDSATETFKLSVLGLFETLWICKIYETKHNRTFDEAVELYTKFADAFDRFVEL